MLRRGEFGIRLALGVYTPVELHDQTPIEALPGPPEVDLKPDGGRNRRPVAWAAQPHAGSTGGTIRLPAFGLMKALGLLGSCRKLFQVFETEGLPAADRGP